MKVSKNGIAVMHYFEACELTAYPDPGSKDGKPWTIGWGHTGPEVAKGLRWTQDQADAAFAEDLVKFENAVSAAVKVSLTQGQFDALVSFAYNLGTGSLKSSTLLRKLNAKDYEGAEAEFARWVKNDGKTMRGLVRRRAAEAALFDGADSKHAIAYGVSQA